MTKYSAEFKLQVVQHYLTQEVGATKTAKHFGIDQPTVRAWVALYRTHGDAGLVKRQSKPDAKYKVKVIKWMAANGCSAFQACAHFNIRSPIAVRRWQRLYNEGGIDALTRPPRPKNMPKAYKPLDKPPSEMTPEELMRELQYLRAENAYLKKLEALVQSRKSALKTKRGS